MTDPISLTQQLIRFPSVTPQEAGTFAFISDFLSTRGFTIEHLDSENVSNLYARRGTASPHLCFVGHVDVVPPGDLTRWSVDPFAGDIRDSKLYGRGVVDMKGAIAAFLAALDQDIPPNGSVSVLLTSDEEGPAIHGIQYVVEQFKKRGESIDACLVGEPTNQKMVGDTIKVGRRGSLNALITIDGKAGHVAYPHLANNPILPLLTYLQNLLDKPLDQGMEHFDPSHLEVTSIDVGNPTSNVIPSQASAKFNIRFNPLHTRDALTQYLHDQAKQAGFTYTLETQGSGDAFICEDPALQNLVKEVVLAVTGQTPTFSTSGGTSDARFMKDLCPVLEFGLIHATAHQADEHIEVQEIQKLTEVYQEILKRHLGDRIKFGRNTK